MVSVAVRHLFDEYGNNATLRTFSDSGNRNNQGEVEFNESTQSLDVIIGWEGAAPRVVEQALGESVFVEEEIFAITDDITLTVKTDAVDKKPRIEYDDQIWKVERTIESPDPPGITMFQTQRLRA